MPSKTSSDRPSTPITNSGIQTLPTGNSIIPSSVRSDGSTRKEIKVRPGYRPPEDQEKYRNRIVEIRDKIGKGGIPGVGPASTPIKLTEEKNKNAKRREAAARKRTAKAAAADGNEVADAAIEDVSNGVGEIQLEPSKTDQSKRDWRDQSKLVTNKEIPGEVDEAAEQEKKARSLKKKLRQARELKEKKEEGGELLPEQLAKVTKIQELVRELDQLGYDANGEPKP